jgi:DNA polymerase-3 subunit epsilon
MKFICLDVETANMWSGSICQVGMSIVENSNIIETKSWLVNPDSFFDDFNTGIHGITAEMVKGSPKINELWHDISRYFNDEYFIVAHNAKFDILALNKALNPFCDELEFPALVFVCSMAMARRTWQNEPSYSLQSLCAKFGIEYGNHDAGADAKSCAELTIKIFQEKNIDMSMQVKEYEDVLLLENKLQVYFGCLNQEGFLNSVCKHIQKPSLKTIIGNAERNDPDSLFYQKKVVFTGTLSSMTRTEAMQQIADIGGYPEKGVTSTTNILVIGQQDYKIDGESGMSSKQKKAIEMKEKGFDIEILSEEDFLQNI